MLLVAQRLDRRGVEALSARGQRQVHRELADHRLARAGRRAHQHAVAVLQRLAGAPLEVVERERQLCGEAGQLGRSGGVVIDTSRDGVGTAVGASIGFGGADRGRLVVGHVLERPRGGPCACR